jgi:hypothetical protein
MPMVLASIGELPPTIMDRSIIINLRRKKAHEHTEIMPVDMHDLNKQVRDGIQAWCTANELSIRSSAIKPPEGRHTDHLS